MRTSPRDEYDLYVETAYGILFQDEHMLIAEKPAPLPVHPVSVFRNRNLKSLILSDYKMDFLAPVNRLDSETSGLVVFAKSSHAAGELGKQFENRTVEKDYRGIVMGTPELSSGSVAIPLGTDARRGHKIRIADTAGETALTRYEVLETRGAYSLLSIKPETGRTHQIRAHLAFIGCPLVGDKLYIQQGIFENYIENGWLESMRETVKLSRLALHASRLKLKHPVTQREMEFISALPPMLSGFWENLI